MLPTLCSMTQLIKSGYRAANHTHEAEVCAFLVKYSEYDNTLWDQGNFLMKRDAESGVITDLYYCPFNRQTIGGDDIYSDVERM